MNKLFTLALLIFGIILVVGCFMVTLDLSKDGIGQILIVTGSVCFVASAILAGFFSGKPRRKFTPLMISLMLSLVLFTPLVQAQVEPQEVVDINLPNYALGTPVQVSVSYTYTQDYAINVSTFTQPHHQEISEPTGITFKTNEPDVYTIHIQVRYDVWVNQTITLTMFEANQTGQIIELSIFSKGFNLDMVISASVPPTIPTADENAEAFYRRFSGEMNELFQHEQRISGSLTDANLFIGGIAAVSFAFSLATIIALAYVMKRNAELAALVKKRVR